jgi:hypothetical protein
MQRPVEVKRVGTLEPRCLREAGELVVPWRHVEIAGEDKRTVLLSHEIHQGENVGILQFGIKWPREMRASDCHVRPVHLDLAEAQDERGPRRRTCSIDATILGDVLFEKDHKAVVAGAVGIARAQYLAELAPMIAGHLLHHHEVGIGVG